MPWWSAAAVVLGGLAWIPVRLGVSVAWSTDFLRFTINRPGAAEVLSWEQVPYQVKA